MFKKITVLKALKKCWASDFSNRWTNHKPPNDQDSVTSLVIYDIFGGEILKTPKKKGWHFYNRIEGKRIDFTNSELDNASLDNGFEDIPSNPEEVCNYFETEDYTTLRRKFIIAYEEVVGLKNHHYNINA